MRCDNRSAGYWWPASLLILLLVTAGCGEVSSGPVGEGPTEPAERPSTTLPATISATTAPASPTPQATPTPVDIATMAIIDAHFHADDAWDMPALLRLMDALGVGMAGSGSKGADALALEFVAARPQRFFAFARLDVAHKANLAEGSRSWNLESPAVVAALELLERGLKAGCWRGIGELFVNTQSSHVSNKVRQPADSPLMRRLWALSAAYRVPLGVHMDADTGSVAEMERVLALDRDGIWLWAHSGWFAEPSLLRRLLQAHPNLYLELSFRDSLRSYAAVDISGRLRPEWRALIEEMPERFLLGTDVLAPTEANYAALISLWRGVLTQLPTEAAVMVGRTNAERLLGLVERPMGADDARRCLTMGL